MYFATNLRYLRRQNGYSQQDIARILGYSSFTTIQKWESGVSTPPLNKYIRLAEIFSVDMDDFARKDLTAE